MTVIVGPVDTLQFHCWFVLKYFRRMSWYLVLSRNRAFTFWGNRPFMRSPFIPLEMGRGFPTAWKVQGSAPDWSSITSLSNDRLAVVLLPTDGSPSSWGAPDLLTADRVLILYQRQGDDWLASICDPADSKVVGLWSRLVRSTKRKPISRSTLQREATDEFTGQLLALGILSEGAGMSTISHPVVWIHTRGLSRKLKDFAARFPPVVTEEHFPNALGDSSLFFITLPDDLGFLLSQPPKTGFFVKVPIADRLSVFGLAPHHYTLDEGDALVYFTSREEALRMSHGRTAIELHRREARPKSRTLSIGTFNIRTLSTSKLPVIREMLSSCSLDILVLTETKVDTVDGFGDLQVVYTYRETRAGGVAVLVHPSLRFASPPTIRSGGNIDVIRIDFHGFNVVGIYRRPPAASPSEPSAAWRDLVDGNTVFLGDFNLRPEAFLESPGNDWFFPELARMPSEVTRIQGESMSALDHILLPHSMALADGRCGLLWPDSSVSDHALLWTKFLVPSIKQPTIPKGGDLNINKLSRAGTCSQLEALLLSWLESPCRVMASTISKEELESAWRTITDTTYTALAQTIGFRSAPSFYHQSKPGGTKTFSKSYSEHQLQYFQQYSHSDHPKQAWDRLRKLLVSSSSFRLPRRVAFSYYSSFFGRPELSDVSSSPGHQLSVEIGDPTLLPSLSTRPYNPPLAPTPSLGIRDDPISPVAQLSRDSQPVSAPQDISSPSEGHPQVAQGSEQEVVLEAPPAPEQAAPLQGNAPSEVFTWLSDLPLPTDSEKEFQDVINQLHAGTSPGLDRIPNQALRAAPRLWARVICLLFAACLRTQSVPVWLSASKVVPIFKGAKATNVDNQAPHLLAENYRPISVANSAYNVIARVLNKYISQDVASCIHPFQTGFVAGCSTLENLFFLQSAINHNSKSGIAVASLDIRKAYDSVDRSTLVSLIDRKPGTVPWDWVKLVYGSPTFARVVSSEGLTDPFLVTKGIRQGDPLSPALFDLYLDSVVRELNCNDLSPNMGIAAREEGLKIAALAYADDLILMASSLEDLQALLTRAVQALAPLHLSLAPDKCVLMTNITHTLPVVIPDFSLESGSSSSFVLREANQIEYLGSILSISEGGKPAAEKLLKKFRARLSLLSGVLSSQALSIPTKRSLFKVVLRASVEYACFIPGIDRSFWKRIQNIQVEAAALMLGLSKMSNRRIVKRESRLLKIRRRAEILQLSFVSRLRERASCNSSSPNFIGELLLLVEPPLLEKVLAALSSRHEVLSQIPQLGNGHNRRRSSQPPLVAFLEMKAVDEQTRKLWGELQSNTSSPTSTFYCEHLRDEQSTSFEGEKSRRVLLRVLSGQSLKPFLINRRLWQVRKESAGGGPLFSTFAGCVDFLQPGRRPEFMGKLRRSLVGLLGKEVHDCEWEDILLVTGPFRELLEKSFLSLNPLAGSLVREASLNLIEEATNALVSRHTNHVLFFPHARGRRSLESPGVRV